MRANTASPAWVELPSCLRSEKLDSYYQACTFPAASCPKQPDPPDSPNSTHPTRPPGASWTDQRRLNSLCRARGDVRCCLESLLRILYASGRAGRALGLAQPHPQLAFLLLFDTIPDFAIAGSPALDLAVAGLEGMSDWIRRAMGRL